MVTNTEFLTALFGEDVAWVHVTDFPYDPGNIPKDKHLIAWKGDYFSRYQMQAGSNQYFTISNFYADETGQARRRKALFRYTKVIVLDDVKEKLAMNEVMKLPRPAWILETSAGSEQWGYILNTPCTDRAMVENLLDGLVTNGLAPDGKDPGMKGVTRYVRLPEGYNTKASKLVGGLPFKCRMLLWEPFNRVSIEQLAAPFAVDLHAVRREARVDGAAAVSDHPLINIPDIIHIKEVRSDGRFDITCPWVHSHTGQDDSGSAIFTNSDGSIGFKCHHGSCQERTGRDLIAFIDRHSPGFSGVLKNWQIMRDFKEIATPDFMGKPIQQAAPVASAPAPISFMGEKPAAPVETTQPDALQLMCDELRRSHPTSNEAREIAAKVLKHADDLPKLDQIQWHNQVTDLMGWTKGEFKDILKDLRKQWYGEKISTAEFYDDVVFVKELNQFYDWKSRIFFSAEAFQNSFSHEDAEARKIALQEGRVKKVDRLDYAPKMQRMFIEGGIIYGNTWSDETQPKGYQGDIDRWRGHFGILGWNKYEKHVMQWMAYTLKHPENKINHMLLLGGKEGTGKDFLLYPLIEGMGENHTIISGEELLRDFDDYLLSTKYLHINETELGDRREATAISNKLKPLASQPPYTLRVNQKGIKPIKIRNIVNATMTTNSIMPLRLNGTSRRFLGLWSDFNPRNEHDDMRPEWLQYWNDRWSWMKGEKQYSGYIPGWQNVVHYLLNEVDLSDFNPDAAPPMTQFLRDISEASKSPMEQTVEMFIKKQHGAFRCDLLTPSDMAETLKAGTVFAPGDMFVDSRYISPVKVGMTLRQIGKFMQLKAYHLGYPVNLWVIRDFEKYKDMESKDLYKEYERQMTAARGAAQLQVVK